MKVAVGEMDLSSNSQDCFLFGGEILLVSFLMFKWSVIKLYLKWQGFTYVLSLIILLLLGTFSFQKLKKPESL